MPQGLTSHFGSGSRVYVCFAHSEMCPFSLISSTERQSKGGWTRCPFWERHDWKKSCQWFVGHSYRSASHIRQYKFNFWSLQGYPWDKLRQGAIVNDVGGGWGHISTQLYKRYPHLNFILQDLPERTEHAKKVWPNECPQAIAENKIQFKSVDLFVAPPIPHCDIYYVSCVYIAFITFLMKWIWHL